MSGKFQPINRDTAYLLPPSLQDWLPEKHLARFVVDIVDQLDLSELVKRYGGGGKQPYHPARYWLCCFTVMRRGYSPVASWSMRPTIQLPSVLLPATRILTTTRLPLSASVFCRSWKACLCRYWWWPKYGLLKMGNVSLDGTKVKANASKHKAMSWGYANKLEEQLRREVQELLKRAEQADTEEEPEMDIPDELTRREDRLAAIAKPKKR